MDILDRAESELRVGILRLMLVSFTARGVELSIDARPAVGDLQLVDERIRVCTRRWHRAARTHANGRRCGIGFERRGCARPVLLSGGQAAGAEARGRVRAGTERRRSEPVASLQHARATPNAPAIACRSASSCEDLALATPTSGCDERQMHDVP